MWPILGPGAINNTHGLTFSNTKSYNQISMHTFRFDLWTKRDFFRFMMFCILVVIKAFEMSECKTTFEGLWHPVRRDRWNTRRPMLPTIPPSTFKRHVPPPSLLNPQSEPIWSFCNSAVGMVSNPNLFYVRLADICQNLLMFCCSA